MTPFSRQDIGKLVFEIYGKENEIVPTKHMVVYRVIYAGKVLFNEELPHEGTLLSYANLIELAYNQVFFWDEDLHIADNAQRTQFLQVLQASWGQLSGRTLKPSNRFFWEKVVDGTLFRMKRFSLIGDSIKTYWSCVRISEHGSEKLEHKHSLSKMSLSDHKPMDREQGIKILHDYITTNSINQG